MKIKNSLLSLLAVTLLTACGGGSTSSNSEDNFFIKSVMYDNSQTLNVNDDILYIYFNKEIDVNSIDLNDANNNFSINGIGKIGSNSVITYQSDFFRLKIELNSLGTSSNTFSQTDIIKNSTIKSSIGESLSQDNYTINEKDIFSLLKTGQDKSYFVNDDGDLQRGITPSYTRDSNNEIVTDNITKLQWQYNSDNTGNSEVKETWTNANAYCENLSLGGFNNWRLPQIDEFLSIINRGEDNTSTYSIFGFVLSSWYWTSSDASSSQKYSIGLEDGFMDDRNISSELYVRCVR